MPTRFCLETVQLAWKLLPTLFQGANLSRIMAFSGPTKGRRRMNCQCRSICEAVSKGFWVFSFQFLPFFIFENVLKLILQIRASDKCFGTGEVNVCRINQHFTVSQNWCRQKFIYFKINSQILSHFGGKIPIQIPQQTSKLVIRTYAALRSLNRHENIIYFLGTPTILIFITKVCIHRSIWCSRIIFWVTYTYP